MTGFITTRPKPEPAPKNRKKTHHELGGGVSDFVCLDGEGITKSDGSHRYVLFGFGQDQIEDNSGLGFLDVIPFIYEKARPGIANCGFFLGYDFTQIFSTLPENRARMLLTSAGIAARKHRRKGLPSHPVEYAGWQFDMLGNKRLRIRQKNCECPFPSCKCKNKPPWIYICDSGPFFQTSFLNVINPAKWENPIVTPEEYAIILEGKKRRASAVLDDDMRMYNRLENEILARVLREYDKGFRNIGVHLSSRKWFGPGQAAQTWMKGKAPESEQLKNHVPYWFIEACRMSYFGGWFELMMHGIIPGVTHEYDINSAYPYIIASLPCLLHGHYTRGVGRPSSEKNARNDSALVLVRARVEGQRFGERRKRHHIGAMLHRDSNGRISRPIITEGWYWLNELKAAKNAGCIAHIDYQEWVRYDSCDCPPPLAGMENLYLQRIQVGKDTPFGKGAKLVYNSGYGKFAQSVGDPVYGNPVYASLITSGCRTQILNAIASHPKGKSDVCMVATDAIYFRSEHPGLTISDNLGDWSHSTHENLSLFKPGVYWSDDTRRKIAEGQSASFKARGINATYFAGQLARIDKQFADWNGKAPEIAALPNGVSDRWPSVTFRPEFSMRTALQCLIQNDWKNAGQLSHDVELTQSSDPSGKRTLSYWDNDVCRSEPYWFGDGATIDDPSSHPYEKRFGLDDPWSEESLSQNGITPDGYAGDEYRELLTGKE